MYVLQDFDDSLERIINHGIRKPNRTGIDTVSSFGLHCRYMIGDAFPIPTKRRTVYKSIFAELLWMISGSTDVNDLEKMGSRIWTAWRDSEFEKRNGYDAGELGPIYGWSFRHFGAPYSSRKGPAGGADQVQYIIDELNRDRFSRRALINLWDPNVMTTDQVKLPTCHYSFQVLLDTQDRLTGILTQRSGDWLPGVSANIYFYSALMYMFAQQLNATPYELIHNVADAHVYVNQFDAAREYLSRPAIDSPKLILNKAKSIFDYKLEDFVIQDYFPGEKITVPVAV